MNHTTRYRGARLCAFSLCTIVLSLAAAPSAHAIGCDATEQVCINELLVEMPGKDASREYVELRGPAGAVIPANTYFVSIDGDKNDNPGRIDTVVNLSGLRFGTADATSPFGFLVLLPQGSTYAVKPNATLVQSTAIGFSGLPGGRWSGFAGTVNYVRPTTSYFLVRSATAPVLGVDIDSDNDGVPNAGSDPEVLYTVLDSVGGSDMQNDRTYARINVRRIGTSSVGTTIATTAKPGYFGRIGDSFGSGASAWALAGVPTGSYPNWIMGVSIPLGFAGKPLNHIGATNAWPNVAPVNTLPASPTALEDTPRLLSGASHIAVADGDGGLNDERVTLAAANGTLALGSTTGLVVTGNGSASLVATGTLAALNAALDTLTFSPAANFNGSGATITVTTDDLGNSGTDGAKSDTDVLAIAVTAVNDAPSFVVGPDPSTFEDAGPQSVPGFATGISAGPANESGQLLAFTTTNNTNPSLFAAGPTIAVDGTLGFTSAFGAVGTATITVQLADDGGTANGGVDRVTRTFTINVANVNDAPEFTAGGPQSVLEDGGAQLVAGWASAIDDGDAGITQAVSFAVTANSNAALFASAPAVAPNGDLTYAPAANANGVATISVVAIDDGGTANGGVNTSAAQDLTITIAAVNDAPSFAVGANPSVLEESGPASIAGFASAASPGPADEAGQQLAFSVTANTNAALFAAAPAIDASGTLTFTPAPDRSGVATITVALTDDGGTANGGIDTATRTFDIVVANVNDPPTFAAGGPQTALEDAGAQTVAGWATNIDDNDAGITQSVSFSVTNNTAPALFAAGPAVDASGTLTYTPAVDANGSATITLVAIDDGGTQDGGNDTSPPQQLTIRITAVNDAPQFVAGPNQTAAANAGPQSANPWATSISTGPADESAQTLSFQVVGNDNLAIFGVAPQVSAAGILTWTPSAATTGTANVQVVAVDSGGTANGGVDTSATRTFTITTTADVTPPTLGAVIDDGDADDFVLVNEALTYGIVFSEPIDAASVSAVDFTNAGTATVVIGNVTANGANATVQVTPTSLGSVVLRISGSITDPSGNALVVPVTDDTTVRARTTTGTTIVSDTLDPSVPGEAYVVTVSVTAPFGTPTGSVAIADDLGQTCNAALAGGTGSCSLTSALGARIITATYAPNDVSYLTSTDTETHDVFRAADVNTTKSDGDNYVERGDPLLYTIVVTNGGPEALVGVRVQDLLPPELVNSIWSCAGLTCPSPSTGTGNIDVLVNLPIGGTVTFSLAADVAANAPNGFVVNQATATLPAGYRDNSPANNAGLDRDELYGIFKDGFE